MSGFFLNFYEQINDDLSVTYRTDRDAEVFAVLPEQARADTFSHIEFLPD